MSSEAWPEFRKALDEASYVNGAVLEVTDVGNAVIQVLDSGIGIPASKFRTVFKEFARLANTEAGGPRSATWRRFLLGAPVAPEATAVEVAEDRGGRLRGDPVHPPDLVVRPPGAARDLHAVPLEQRLAFEEEMRAGGVDWRMDLYGGVEHSFTHPWAELAEIPGVPERKGEGFAKGPKGFFASRDIGTMSLE